MGNAGKRMTDAIIEQILTIRESGAYNMLDIKGVQYEAFQRMFFDLVVLIDENPTLYTGFIMRGKRD